MTRWIWFVATAMTWNQASCAPTDPDWRSLNASVGGRLYRGYAYAAPCYNAYDGQSQPINKALCRTIRSKSRDALYLDEQFGSALTTNWATCASTGAACPVYQDNSSTTCSSGSVPSYYISVASVSDVQNGLAFAQANNVPIVVKNTGHDYRGRSTARGALALWTHRYQPDMTFSSSFTPEGCSKPTENVITMGAGQQFQGLYDFADKNGRDVVGGTEPTVGVAGGWITGGGHSLLSPAHGLGVDNTVQIKAVLPNGTYVTANRCQNQDLFFALRGGGGGTFGIIMELAYATIPQRTLRVSVFPPLQLDQDGVRDFTSIFIDNGARWASEGWGGFFNLTADYKVPGCVLVNPKLSALDASQSLKPLKNFYLTHGIPLLPKTISLSFGSFHGLFGLLHPFGTSHQYVGGSASLSSRLIPRKYFTSPNTQGLKDAFLETIYNAHNSPDSQGKSFLVGLVAPSNYSLPASDRPGGPGEASVNPVWRNSIWHIVHANEWSGDLVDPAFVQNKFQTTHDDIKPLRELTPDGGAYLNEADTFEPDFTTSFWGPTYQRLLAVKQTVDPKNVLTNNQAVGWDPTDSRFACYPRINL